MNRILIVFSIQRTGSTYIKQVINSLNEFEFLGEVYNRGRTNIQKNRELKIIEYILSQSKKHKINYKNITSKSEENINLKKFRHIYPQLFFESMLNTSQSKYFGFKIFLNQLPINEMVDLFLKDKKIKKIILKRNLLDSYTSLLIARHIKAYGNVDTSNLKINFQGEDFKQWLDQVVKFYSFLESKALEAPQEYSFLSYEELNRHDNNRDKFQFIIQFLQKIGFDINVEQNIEAKIDQKFLFNKKQDFRSNILEKYHNPNDVKKFLVDHDLQYLQQG